MHWTAQVSRAGRINAAVNPAVDPISGQPELKHTPVEIRRLAVQWHGTILARRPVMLPQIAYWTQITGAGITPMLAGEQPLATARRALSAAMRTANPGPWLDGDDGIGAVIGDGRLEAVMVLGETRDEAVRDRLAPFMAIDRLGVEQRNLLLQGGDAADRGGEMCACFGVSCAAVETAIAGGATTARRGRRHHPRRHQLRLLPSRNPRCCCAPRAPKQGRRLMQSFPLFLSLQDRRALVVGGTEPAARKVELLLSAGAQVSLIAETVTGEIAQLIADGRISWAGRTFDEADLAGMSLVIVATDDEALQARVSHAAQQRCVPVNVVDRPQLSSFIMPAIVDRGPITIAISTGGAAPALARRLRAEIERALPAAIGRLARFAEIFRDQVRRTLDEPRARRRFWDRVFAGRVGELALAGDEIAARRELIRLLDSARNETAPGGRHGASGRRRSRRSRPADPEGASPAAARRRRGLRPAGRRPRSWPWPAAMPSASLSASGAGSHGVPQEEINARLVASPAPARAWCG